MSQLDTLAQAGARALMDRMTRAQRVAFSYPCLDPRAALEENSDQYQHFEDDKWKDTAWRVALIIDANPKSCAAARWPCWHVTAIYGERRNGRGHATTPDRALYPLVEWAPTRFLKCKAMLAKNLQGVGEPESVSFWPLDADDARRISLARGKNPLLLAGMSARKLLTRDEAMLCLPRHALAAINPSYDLAIPDPTGMKANGEGVPDRFKEESEGAE